MAKSQVLLVFGNHGNRSKNHSPDRRFFRKAATPFLRKCAKKGKPVLFILENVITIEGYDSEAKRKMLDQQDHLKNKSMQKFDAAIEIMMKEQGPIIQQLGLWGLEKEVQRLNEKNAGQVMLRLEPFNSEILYALWEDDIAEEKFMKDVSDTEAGAVYMKAKADTTFLRDSLVAKYVAKFCAEHPEYAVLILRGAMHRKIVKLLDHNLLEVSYREKQAYDKLFLADVVFERYDGELDYARVRKFAKLQSYGTDSEIKVPIGNVITYLIDYLMTKFYKLIRARDKVAKLTNARLRKEAIANNPEIARELGIEK